MATFTSEIMANPVDYGADISVFPDLDESMTLRPGRLVLADSIARMLITPTGSLEFHPDEGVDIRGYLNDVISDVVLARLQAACRAQVERDPRVDEAQVDVTFISESKTLRVRVRIYPLSEGPFDLVLSVNELTAVLETLD